MRVYWDAEAAAELSAGRARLARVFTMRPTPPGDVLWVTMTYGEKLPVSSLLVAEEPDPAGHLHSWHSPGAFLDESRRASVSKWPLTGGIEGHRGKTIHIRTMSHGKELARIEVR